MNMRTSSAGIELIKEFESCRLKAYMPTPNDVPTIGYGHTRNVYMGMVITQDEADAFLVNDLIPCEECIERWVDVDLEQEEFDALVSFIFNVGVGAFRNSTLLKLLNLKRYRAAADQFLRWNKQAGVVLNGLTRRRRAERELFLSCRI